jgi:hypothetical protein
LPGLVPGIHVLATGIAKAREDVDGRVKPGQRGSLVVYGSLATTGFPRPDSRGPSPAKRRSYSADFPPLYSRSIALVTVMLKLVIILTKMRIVIL